MVEHERGAPASRADRDLDGEQRERRAEGDDEREQDDVRWRRSANREELRVPAEDVEQRLREREPRDREQLGAAHRRLAKALDEASAGLRDRGCVFHS